MGIKKIVELGLKSYTKHALQKLFKMFTDVSSFFDETKQSYNFTGTRTTTSTKPVF